MLTPDTLKAIAIAGGGLDFSNRGFTTATLVDIAHCAAQSGARPHIVIRVDVNMAPNDLTQIAAAGQGCVVFRFPDYVPGLS